MAEVLTPEARATVLRTWCARGTGSSDDETVVVSGDSMLPTLEGGERILLDPGSRPRVGEVIVFADPRGNVVVHRLVGRRGDRFVCLGDNRRTFDPYVPNDTVIGVVTRAVDAVDQSRPIPRTSGLGWLTLSGRCLVAAVLAVGARRGGFLRPNPTREAQ